ncbi:MAG: DEAD/DEAH box helicase [Cyclobacteriaceae bacterium]|nr:DEAD/DEAH box helicase [Cyclobacteriaceae bacterium]
MNISAQDKFQIIYSIFKHEYLGFLFESFVVRVDEKGQLTLQHQNISSLNATEFSSGLDDQDFELIDLIDGMQQGAILKKYASTVTKSNEFFPKVFDEEKGNKALQQQIDIYLKGVRAKILPLLVGKYVFEMGNDGEPTWRKLDVMPEKASVLFHFRRNEDNTHYFPTIKYKDQKVDFQYKGGYLLSDEPAWLVVEGRIYSFKKNIDGAKLRPFLNKKFILIPQKVEDTYYRKFIAPLVAHFDVYAKGFDINTKHITPTAELTFSPLAQLPHSLTLDNGNSEIIADVKKFVFSIELNYEGTKIKPTEKNEVVVNVEKTSDSYIFNRISRNLKIESDLISYLKELDLDLSSGKSVLGAGKAFDWIQKNRLKLADQNIELIQEQTGERKYFVGDASIKIDINENIDWFDIKAVILFGEFEIAFFELRKLILKGKNELKLPNGEIAIIPASWLQDYSELFYFSEDSDDENPILKKHHLALVQELENVEHSKVIMNKKLYQLRNFDKIDDHPMPEKFKGTLRPYQKAGYDWLQFLNQYNLGGCLADDMGLGKTVQTLALLQSQKEGGAEVASLLVMPTSLVYNWQKEAKKFTPNLRVFNYTGVNRTKDIGQFTGYDLVITSYGIIRRDLDILAKYKFHYIILDESQAIKNPTSNISKAVRELHSKYRLILTGTPIENSTMDLWSQMSFINPGLLGHQSFFRKQFQIPIEKHNNEDKSTKLFSLIKPFVMRRHKSQVAKDLPKKVENIHYSSMTTLQAEMYEETKNMYRNEILSHIDAHGMGKSQMILLQGLTKLRLIANHPKMADPEYVGDSGKLDDMMHMLTNTLSEGHKILIFSQFVKHLTIVKEIIETRGFDYCYLDGATKNRQAEVERFQEDSDVKIFLISMKAGGLGLNLTEADYVFLLDPWWNPAVEAQAIDRAHRIGQKKKVFTYKFITKNTVEEKILELQSRKLKLAKDLISIDNSFVKSLSKEDIGDLLG